MIKPLSKLNPIGKPKFQPYFFRSSKLSNVWLTENYKVLPKYHDKVLPKYHDMSLEDMFCIVYAIGWEYHK